ncbi:MAG: biotin--[acetyl-CoA-carboxylase] ligase [Bacteroidaceae bacterium]|nr:biotin--[acetyl-CoA-carboxylase] ligase [Bacteroidaceae bacterium]
MIKKSENSEQRTVKIIRVAETDSTSKEIVRELERSKAREYISVLQADYQTAGRGQQGNSWESERGKNLLFSVMLWPQGVEVSRQFRLSQAMAVAVRDALAQYADGFTIKWPNDIYYGEKKVSGTIIETTWKGEMVERCVIGVGINVNQREFHSDAPNPVSMCQIVGREVSREELLDKVMERFVTLYERLGDDGDEEIGCAYMSHLFWREGMHRYCDADGEFEAEVLDVAADGHLTLRDREGRERKYYFKELRFEKDRPRYI